MSPLAKSQGTSIVRSATTTTSHRCPTTPPGLASGSSGLGQCMRLLAGGELGWHKASVREESGQHWLDRKRTGLAWGFCQRRGLALGLD